MTDPTDLFTRILMRLPHGHVHQFSGGRMVLAIEISPNERDQLAELLGSTGVANSHNTESLH